MSFKKSSEVIAVSGRVEESAANTFTTQEINLSLDPLNNEVFVVLAMDTALSAPDYIVGTNTGSLFQLSSTTQTAISGLEEPNVMLRTERLIQSPGAGESLNWEHVAGESPQAVLDYVQIIATPNFHAQIQGSNNSNVMSCAYRVWGYRAQATASTYAALVQSEVLSQ
tara:strand:- start:636 stop:1139 length:504 start_codon:yes stop_codon:yes gene_type:complete